MFSYFATITSFGKEFLLVNDSLVIFFVFGVLFGAIIKYAKDPITLLMATIRVQTRNDFAALVHSFLTFYKLYQNNLETLIYLNLNRVLLLPIFDNVIEDKDPSFEEI